MPVSSATMAVADGGGSLAITEMTTGMSASGMETYLENIKAEILTNVQGQLDTARDNINNKLKQAWVGQSEERFEQLLTKAVDDVKVELEAEYNALAARIGELQNDYYNQENALIAE